MDNSGVRQTTAHHGDARTAEILEVFPFPTASDISHLRPRCTVLVDDRGEGHIIADVTHDIEPIIGMKVTLQFYMRRDGGFWKITGEVR